uniref:Uncharacterized protein n=1 Tax=Oryza brachyantha TaxID=4533 RepID=J3M038_ORYBR
MYVSPLSITSIIFNHMKRSGVDLFPLQPNQVCSPLPNDTKILACGYIILNTIIDVHHFLEERTLEVWNINAKKYAMVQICKRCLEAATGNLAAESGSVEAWESYDTC